MSDAVEIWKPVPGYEDRYDVSNLGRVRARASLVTHCYCGGHTRVSHRHYRKERLLVPQSKAIRGGPSVFLAGYRHSIADLVMRAFGETVSG